MIDPLSPEQKRQQFDTLLAAALDGKLPLSNNGLPGEVEDVLIQVALGDASESDAVSVYESSI